MRVAMPPSQRAAITCFFLLSGATALVYQVIWVRMLGLSVGHSVYAIATVVATYMAGLGLGARLAGEVADRARRPLCMYGGLEIFVGAYALASPALLALGSPLACGLGESAVSLPSTLALAAVTLLPPTVAMGATLPYLTRWYARDGRTLGRDMGWLYAVNTTGAVAGAALAGFVLLPFLGQPASIAAAAAVNIVVGAAAVGLGLRLRAVSADAAAPLADRSARPPDAEPSASSGDTRISIVRPAPRIILPAFALSGVAGMVNEVAWIRCFELFTGSTTYAFSLILCAFIAGLALGTHLASRWVDRARDLVLLLALINLGIAAAVCGLIPLIGELPLLLIRPLAAVSDSFAGRQLLVLGVLFAIVLLPTVLMGATYPVATRALAHSPRVAARVVGRAYAWNTLGAIAGSLIGGLVLVPLAGLRDTMWIAVGVSLLATAVLLGSRWRMAWALPALAVAALWICPDWNPRHMNLAPYLYARDLADNEQALALFRDSGSVVFHEEGVGATVTVLQRQTGARVLRINGKTDASTLDDRLSQGFVGSLPLLLASDPSSMLLIGVGSGMTLAAGLEHPIERVTAVELLPEVLRAADHFGVVLNDPLTDPRVDLRAADGRAVLRCTEERYDIISSYPTNLFISGMSTLVTVETFEAMRDSLAPGGVVALWMQGYLLSDQDFRTVLRTFQSVFPETHLWNSGLYDLCVTGHTAPLVVDPAIVERRIGAVSRGWVTHWAGIHGPLDLQRHYLMGPDTLRAYVGPGRIQRDRDPFLEFSAPRALYDPSLRLDPAALLARRELLPVGEGLDSLAQGLEQRRQETGSIEQAIVSGDLEQLAEAMRADPGHPSGTLRLAFLMYQHGSELYGQGDLDGALQMTQAVIQMEPMVLPARQLAAAIHDARGQQQEALEVLRAARDQFPWNVYAHLGLAQYALQIGALDEGQAALAAARALDPDLPELAEQD